MKQLEKKFGNANVDDMLIVFISTHCIPSADGEQAYFLTYDADPVNLPETAVSHLDIERVIKKTSAKKIIIICDGFRGGAGLELRTGYEGDLKNIFSELAAAKDSTAIFLSSETTEFSREGKQWDGGHGIFTKLLLDGLNRDADMDSDGKVTIEEIQNYLSQHISNETDNHQHPLMLGSFPKYFPLSKLK